jgi:hypothetical protein
MYTEDTSCRKSICIDARCFRRAGRAFRRQHGTAARRARVACRAATDSSDQFLSLEHSSSLLAAFAKPKVSFSSKSLLILSSKLAS